MMELLATAFAAGTGTSSALPPWAVYSASAMTAIFLARILRWQSDSQSAMGSVVALIGSRHWLRRGVLLRAAERRTSAEVLSQRDGFVVGFRIVLDVDPFIRPCAFPITCRSCCLPSQGLQAVIGQTISLTTIVVYDDADQVVGTIADSLPRRYIGSEGCGKSKAR